MTSNTCRVMRCTRGMASVGCARHRKRFFLHSVIRIAHELTLKSCTPLYGAVMGIKWNISSLNLHKTLVRALQWFHTGMCLVTLTKKHKKKFFVVERLWKSSVDWKCLKESSKVIIVTRDLGVTWTMNVSNICVRDLQRSTFCRERSSVQKPANEMFCWIFIARYYIGKNNFM